MLVDPLVRDATPADAAAPRLPRGAPRRRTLLTGALVGALALGASGVAAHPAGAAKAPKRVVALTPFTANVTARLGVRPIAVGQQADTSKLKLSSKLKGVKRLPLSHPDGPNIQQLVYTRPDLVLSSPNWRSGTPRMRQQRIRVIDSFEPVRLATVSIGMRKIGKVLGRAKQGERLARASDRAVRRARKGIAARPTVLVVLGIGRNTMAFLPNSWGGDIVSAAGGRLITSGLKPAFGSGIPGSFATISNEEIVLRKPEVIIVVPHGNVKDIPRTVEYFRTQTAWKSTPAAINGRVHVVDPQRLLEASDDPAKTIRWVRKDLLRNWE